ncbi:hypothetical protein [Lactococcus taiwanensis]|uniref:hypothetical protein n=1 Tax=Lactococcus taiwanensis TaxID=1151742 RepID=UPI0028AD7CD8|nr:hypothetical protein [Lactococcus taiwanensis]
MKFIKMDVVRSNQLNNWWIKFSGSEFKRVLLVNEAKVPKRQLQLKRGGKA